LRLIAVAALEGLAADAAARESWVEALRLVGAAQRLRDETGYRWRFECEEKSIRAIHGAAHALLGDAASSAIAQGTSLIGARPQLTHAGQGRAETAYLG